MLPTPPQSCLPPQTSITVIGTSIHHPGATPQLLSLILCIQFSTSPARFTLKTSMETSRARLQLYHSGRAPAHLEEGSSGPAQLLPTTQRQAAAVTSPLASCPAASMAQKIRGPELAPPRRPQPRWWGSYSGGLALPHPPWPPLSPWDMPGSFLPPCSASDLMSPQPGPSLHLHVPHASAQARLVTPLSPRGPAHRPSRPRPPRYPCQSLSCSPHGAFACCGFLVYLPGSVSFAPTPCPQCTVFEAGGSSLLLSGRLGHCSEQS